MNMIRSYGPYDKMMDLIGSNYALLQVMNRFGIPLGLGEQTVEEACMNYGVHCPTFIAVMNFVSEGSSRLDENMENISVPALIGYLRNTHSYFLDFYFPLIKDKLTEAIPASPDGMKTLILKCFDDYASLVRKHMESEEDTVFAYAGSLLDGKCPDGYEISTFSKHHDQVGEKLTEFKNILIKYCPSNSDNNLLNSALLDIYYSEEGLDTHCRVEDLLFVPAIQRLEKTVAEKRRTAENGK